MINVVTAIAALVVSVFALCVSIVTLTVTVFNTGSRERARYDMRASGTLVDDNMNLYITGESSESGESESVSKYQICIFCGVMVILIVSAGFSIYSMGRVDGKAIVTDRYRDACIALMLPEGGDTTEKRQGQKDVPSSAKQVGKE